MRKKYECILIFNPNLDDEVLTKEISFFEEFVTQNKGAVLNKSIPKKIEIGYKIKKKKEGLYVVVDFSLDSGKIKNLDKALRLKDTIFRFTIILKEAKEVAI